MLLPWQFVSIWWYKQTTCPLCQLQTHHRWLLHGCIATWDIYSLLLFVYKTHVLWCVHTLDGFQSVPVRDRFGYIYWHCLWHNRQLWTSGHCYKNCVVYVVSFSSVSILAKSTKFSSVNMLIIQNLCYSYNNNYYCLQNIICLSSM